MFLVVEFHLCSHRFQTIKTVLAPVAEASTTAAIMTQVRSSLTQIEDARAEQPKMSPEFLSYTYDAFGNITQIFQSTHIASRSAPLPFFTYVLLNALIVFIGLWDPSASTTAASSTPIISRYFRFTITDAARSIWCHLGRATGATITTTYGWDGLRGTRDRK